MNFGRRAREIGEEVVDAIKDYRTASQVGDEIGREAYRQGLEPGDVGWGTVEAIAQERNLNLDKYINRDVVAEHINEGWDSQAYHDEQQQKPFWAR